MNRGDRAQRERAFYEVWRELLEWMKSYAGAHEAVFYKTEADFPDYIYRMERPYDLPVITMTASLNREDGHPVVLLSASPRHAVFKEITLHPFDSHVYRKLKWSPEKDSLVEERKRPFTREMFEHLMDELFGFRTPAAGAREPELSAPKVVEAD
ncbi:MAG: NADH-quinone oxidoreductase subunit 15 [Deinococcota bacterium]|jgi:hypothetical protein|nr:NADH-quinone oxidoreductase subunit 15 [Deinococcota bacterium]